MTSEPKGAVRITTPNKRSRKDITPTNQENTFDIEDLFFSKTDHSSKILYANEIFTKIAKYDFDEMVDQFHNIVRHPDMPKGAFRLLWDYLLRGEAVAAYVKNLCSDGSYYWVMALAFPVEDGYMSIRLKPTAPLFTKMKAMYQEVLEYEKGLLAEHDREQAISASAAYILELLKKDGYDDFDKFMKFALMSEIYHREEILATREKNRTYFSDFDRELDKTNSIMAEMVLLAEKLEQMHDKLLTHSNFILHLSNTILSIAINARLQSSKLDQSDQSLSVISEKMGEQTQWGEENLKKIIESIEDMYTLFGNLNFNVIASKIQIEMSLRFYWETKRAEEKNGINLQQQENFEQTINSLKKAYTPRLQALQKHIGDVPVLQNQISNSMKDIEKYLTILRFIYITGKVEITRMSQKDASFQETFEDLIHELERADEHLTNLRNVINDNNALFSRYSILNQQLREIQS